MCVVVTFCYFCVKLLAVNRSMGGKGIRIVAFSVYIVAFFPHFVAFFTRIVAFFSI